MSTAARSGVGRAARSPGGVHRTPGGAEGLPTADASGAVAELLVRSLTGEDLSQVDLAAISPELLTEAADWHRVGPAVFLALDGSDLQVGADLVAPMRRAYDKQVLHQLRTLADLRTAAGALVAAGVPWALVKGAAAARWWPRQDMREYRDLDLLVDRRRFGDALEALDGAGARLVDVNWPLIRDQLRAELTLVLPFGTRLDLHWDLVNDADLRRDFRFPTRHLLERAVTARLGSAEAPVLDDVDALLHLGYHTTISGGYRLLWLMDMAVAWRRGVDRTVVDSRARAWGVDLPLRLALDRAARVLTRPEAVRTRPGRSWAWRSAAAAADTVVTVPWVPGRRGTARLFYQNARSTTGRSLAAAVRELRRRPGAERSSSAVANPLHRDVPDARARGEYLAAVQGARRP